MATRAVESLWGAPAPARGRWPSPSSADLASVWGADVPVDRRAFIIEQDEPATELFCLLSGSADVAVENEDGTTHRRDTVGVGGFIGEDGLFSGRNRNAHVIARDAVTCLVLSPQKPSPTAGRGNGAVVSPRGRGATSAEPSPTDAPQAFEIEVGDRLDDKVAALAAHRSQYALDSELLPRTLLEHLLGTEHFVVAGA